MSYRSWHTLWTDRRKFSQRIGAASLFAAFCAWAMVSISVAQSLPDRPGAAIQTNDLIQWQWATIAGLLGLVGLLVGFIFLYLWNSTKRDVRELYRDKLGVDEHRNMDHSQLCPVCRDAHLSIGVNVKGGR